MVLKVRAIFMNIFSRSCENVQSGGFTDEQGPSHGNKKEREVRLARKTRNAPVSSMKLCHRHFGLH
jgi:hypothetical protein